MQRQDIPFTMVANEVLCRTDLSVKAKGLFAYLFSKPDGWQFSSKRIVHEMKESVPTILLILLELEKSGLLTRNRQQDGRNEYVLKYTTPHISPYQQPLPMPQSRNASIKKALDKEPLSVSNKYSPNKKYKESNKEIRESVKKLGKFMAVDK